MRISLALVTAFYLFTSAASAAPIITGYDVIDAATSGCGGWAHSYTGTIVTTGGFDGCTRANYSGGAGTMADGAIGTNILESQLFRFTSSGAYAPSITLYLDSEYFVSAISLFNFPSGNAIPGNITGLDVGIGVSTQSFATSVLNSRD